MHNKFVWKACCIRWWLDFSEGKDFNLFSRLDSLRCLGMCSARLAVTNRRTQDVGDGCCRPRVLVERIQERFAGSERRREELAVWWKLVIGIFRFPRNNKWEPEAVDARSALAFSCLDGVKGWPIYDVEELAELTKHVQRCRGDANRPCLWILR